MMDPRHLGVLLAFSLATWVPGGLRGQQSGELGRLYSQGVNAYFAGRSSEAESHLSQALAFEAQDPRMYYFRALSLLRLGRLDEARGDMMVGASIEAQHPQRFAVGKALERVQGGHRLMLERYRREARTQQVALKPVEPPRAVRRQPQQMPSHDQHVLRQRIVIPLDRLLGSGPPQPLSTEELSLRRQAVEARPIPPQPASEATPTAEISDDPFRDDPSQAALAAPAATAQPASAQEGAGDSNLEEATEAEFTPESEESAEAEAMPEADDNPFGSDLQLNQN
jgi:hypothetical protein